ncbi:Cof-type HAD-IIB family hydrolase [Companilactobacillus farciminis]|uniref:Cof-type HAD-IIB family hydrolase n=1 Tax=Companilactobacillus farciminis TaxID=1612 RepID=UPI001915EB5F|nr:Cof-type HAD-IIB family hydrolase [Companilactobacillus farciminis]
MNKNDKTIKIIATDMDGTFLNDDKQYDLDLFKKVRNQLKEKDIKFVIASGNQYQHLVDVFKDSKNELTYIADNGAVIIDNGEIINQTFIDIHELHKSLDLLKSRKVLDNGLIVLSGQSDAYIEKSTPEEFFKEGKKYYRNIKLVNSLYDITDKIYKIALAWPDQDVREKVDFLKKELPNLHITSSGFGGIDIIPNGVNKGTAISFLQNRFSLNNSQIVAFGDSDNDFELLKQVEKSYAMKNANSKIKSIARYRTSWDNNDNGVLKTILQLVN